MLQEVSPSAVLTLSRAAVRAAGSAHARANPFVVFLLHPRLVPFPARMFAAPFLRYAGEWWAATGTGRVATELCGQASS